MNKFEEVAAKLLWAIGFKVKNRNRHACVVVGAFSSWGIRNALKHGIECAICSTNDGIYMIVLKSMQDEDAVVQKFASFISNYGITDVGEEEGEMNVISGEAH